MLYNPSFNPAVRPSYANDQLSRVSMKEMKIKDITENKAADDAEKLYLIHQKFWKEGFSALTRQEKEFVTRALKSASHRNGGHYFRGFKINRSMIIFMLLIVVLSYLIQGADAASTPRAARRMRQRDHTGGSGFAETSASVNGTLSNFRMMTSFSNTSEALSSLGQNVTQSLYNLRGFGLQTLQQETANAVADSVREMKQNTTSLDGYVRALFNSTLSKLNGKSANLTSETPENVTSGIITSQQSHLCETEETARRTAKTNTDAFNEKVDKLADCHNRDALEGNTVPESLQTRLPDAPPARTECNTLPPVPGDSDPNAFTRLLNEVSREFVTAARNNIQNVKLTVQDTEAQIVQTLTNLKTILDSPGCAQENDLNAMKACVNNLVGTLNATMHIPNQSIGTAQTFIHNTESTFPLNSQQISGELEDSITSLVSLLKAPFDLSESKATEHHELAADVLEMLHETETDYNRLAEICNRIDNERCSQKGDCNADQVAQEDYQSMIDELCAKYQEFCDKLLCNERESVLNAVLNHAQETDGSCPTDKKFSDWALYGTIAACIVGCIGMCCCIYKLSGKISEISKNYREGKAERRRQRNNIELVTPEEVTQKKTKKEGSLESSAIGETVEIVVETNGTEPKKINKSASSSDEETKEEETEINTEEGNSLPDYTAVSNMKEVELWQAVEFPLKESVGVAPTEKIKEREVRFNNIVIYSTQEDIIAYGDDRGKKKVVEINWENPCVTLDSIGKKYAHRLAPAPQVEIETKANKEEPKNLESGSEIPDHKEKKEKSEETKTPKKTLERRTSLKEVKKEEAKTSESGSVIPENEESKKELEKVEHLKKSLERRNSLKEFNKELEEFNKELEKTKKLPQRSNSLKELQQKSKSRLMRRTESDKELKLLRKKENHGEELPVEDEKEEFPFPGKKEFAPKKEKALTMGGHLETSTPEKKSSEEKLSEKKSILSLNTEPETPLNSSGEEDSLVYSESESFQTVSPLSSPEKKEKPRSPYEMGLEITNGEHKEPVFQLFDSSSEEEKKKSKSGSDSSEKEVKVQKPAFPGLTFKENESEKEESEKSDSSGAESGTIGYKPMTREQWNAILTDSEEEKTEQK